MRYKDFKLLKKEEVKEARLRMVVEPGTVMEVERVKDVKEALEKCGEGELWEWWNRRWCMMREGGLVDFDSGSSGSIDGEGRVK